MVSHQTPEVQPHSQLPNVIADLDFSQHEKVLHVHLYPWITAIDSVNILLCEKGEKEVVA